MGEILSSQNPGKHRQVRMFRNIVRTEFDVLIVCIHLVVPRSLFETRGWGGIQVRQGSPYSSPLRGVVPNVQEHIKDRMSHPNGSKHFEDRMLSCPRSPPRRCRRTDRCARAPRQLPRRADDYRVQPSTPPPNTSQPPYRPEGHGGPKGSPERLRGPKGFGRRGPLVQLCVFGVSAVWPVGISAVWPVGVSALCRLDSRRVALPHFTR